MDLSSMLAAGRDNTDSAGEGADHEKDAVYSDGSSIEMASSITTSITENNLTKFKEYLESDDCDITRMSARMESLIPTSQLFPFTLMTLMEYWSIRTEAP